MERSPDSDSIAGTDWSPFEVEATVAAYFRMLDLELRGIPFNKAEENRRLQTLMPGRSKGSIEFKHANITAVLNELGFPGIDGYKPRSNYQDLLREIVEDRLKAATDLEALIQTQVTKPEPELPVSLDILSIMVPTPKPERSSKSGSERLREAHHREALRPRNYLEIEARNRSLGRAGEELILRYEHERLWRAGSRALADRIEHVAGSGMDYLGFDILSYETSGKERLIEVKTTRFGALTPFFASRNEVDVSEEKRDHYHLYRIHKFSTCPRVFQISGSLKDTCQLESVSFMGRVR